MKSTRESYNLKTSYKLRRHTSTEKLSVLSSDTRAMFTTVNYFRRERQTIIKPSEKRLKCGTFSYHKMINVHNQKVNDKR